MGPRVHNTAIGVQVPGVPFSFMKTYTYTNSLTGEVVFVVSAESITQADLAYQMAEGIHPSKLCHIGCTVA